MRGALGSEAKCQADGAFAGSRGVSPPVLAQIEHSRVRPSGASSGAVTTSGGAPGAVLVSSMASG